MPRCFRSSPSARRSRSSTATTPNPAVLRAASTACACSSTRRGSPSRTRCCTARSTRSPDRSRIDPMSDDPARKSQEFFGMFLKAKEFTEELLKENERLRYKVAHLEAEGGAPADHGNESAIVRDLTRRIQEL